MNDGREQLEVSLPWILAVLLRERRSMLVVAGVGAAVALVIALLRSPYYTTIFSFVPQSTQSQGTEGLTNLAGQLGFAVGGLGPSQSPQLYADLLKTREVLSAVAVGSVVGVAGRQERVPLAEFLGISGSSAPAILDKTVLLLRRSIISSSVATRTTGVVTVRVRTRSPQVSLVIAERLLDALNRYNLETRRSQAAEERRFIAGRVVAERASLRSAEDALQQFLQANRQFASSSQLRFDRERLERVVASRQQLVTSLAGQFEQARIREVRDTPVITVIERPTLPVMPDPRGRARIIVVGTMAATLLGAMVALLGDGWERQRREEVGDPSYEMLASEWRRFRSGRGRLDSLRHAPEG